MACHRTSSFVGQYIALIGICDGIPLHAGLPGDIPQDINLQAAGLCRQLARISEDGRWRVRAALEMGRCGSQQNSNKPEWVLESELVLELSRNFACSAARFRQKIALILSYSCRAQCETSDLLSQQARHISGQLDKHRSPLVCTALSGTIER